jgi:hypothetical protein
MVDARLGVVVLACLVAVLNGFRQAHDPALWGAAPPQPPRGDGRKPVPRDTRLDAHFAQCAPLPTAAAVRALCAQRAVGCRVSADARTAAPFVHACACACVLRYVVDTVFDELALTLDFGGVDPRPHVRRPAQRVRAPAPSLSCACDPFAAERVRHALHALPPRRCGAAGCSAGRSAPRWRRPCAATRRRRRACTPSKPLRSAARARPRPMPTHAAVCHAHAPLQPRSCRVLPGCVRATPDCSRLTATRRLLHRALPASHELRGAALTSFVCFDHYSYAQFKARRVTRSRRGRGAANVQAHALTRPLANPAFGGAACRSRARWWRRT